jgi:headcase protein
MSIHAFNILSSFSLFLSLQCNSCFKLLLHPHQRLNFFSDYSHPVSCPFCATQDAHFVKPLTYCYTKQPVQQFQQWP